MAYDKSPPIACLDRRRRKPNAVAFGLLDKCSMAATPATVSIVKISIGYIDTDTGITPPVYRKTDSA